MTKTAGPETTRSSTEWADSSNLTSMLGLAPPVSEIQDEVLPLFEAGRVFNVCHVGLVLRAVLGVQGALALGLALGARDATQWLIWMSSGTVVSLSAVLGWLLIVCALRHWLAGLREALQWTTLMLLGALAAWLGWQLLNVASDEPTTAFRLLALTLSGAAVSGVLMYWLKLRERAQRPADALARLVELQSRIRPHFLFNTLNTAIALVRVDPQRAESVLEDLSELFRVALAETHAVVSLDEEVELARRYLEIEQLRFGERLRIHWKLDPQAGATRVPPLLLQPLVENAVRHGVEPNDGGGDLQVSTKVRGGEVEIRVINTISGAPSRPGHGLALRNVRERLRLMHDVAARFEIDRRSDRFSVRIVLPR
ncbi:histidine kinase [Paucibacter sp. APW11]|uniref:Histidine kinase n=1 Tax=Roseateles aquae TaxID=3077235 RepID=A0ABU3P872_9BURK|nr:histidine kinase [Paucibacter sp. APW11]MDT8998430.1 histidine kinase [Paucibacter sp. APW11]